MRSRTLCRAWILASLALPAEAQDSESEWSRFRGPNGSGVSAATGLPQRIGPKQSLRWRRDLAPGHSSPVLRGELLFLTTLEGESLFTLCLEASTGKQIWKREAPRERKEKFDNRNHAAAPTPVVDDERVVVFFADHGLLAYDHEGQKLWDKALAPFNNTYGMGASPILHAGRVYLACDQQRDSFLLALDAKSGQEVWRSERPWAKSGHCTPIVLATEEGGEELILPGSFYLDAYDLEQGERRWWVPGLSFEMKSVPVAKDGLIFINGYGSPLNQPGNQVEIGAFGQVIAEHDKNGDGLLSKEEMPASRATAWFGLADLDEDHLLKSAEWTFLRDALLSQNGMLAIKQGGSGAMNDSSIHWAYRRTVPQLPSPLIYDGVLYMLADSGGLITTFIPASGEVLERGRIAGATDTFYASPVAADGKIWLASEHGLVLALPAGGSLEPLFVSDMKEKIYATPAIMDGCIYLRTEEALYCFEGDSE